MSSGTRLAGKRAIVTGGASGIGAAIARRFVAEGAAVLIADLDAAAAVALARELGAAAFGTGADVADAPSVALLAREAELRLGALDILVNNAGIGLAPQPLETLPEAQFDRVLAVNARSIYLTARAFVPGFKARRRGAILNIGSTAGVSPRPGLTWYNASKGWVITATRSMAVELAPSGIRVNALNPVATDTPMLPTFLGSDTAEARAKFVATIPLGRLATPTDMAHAALYLCSDEASMVTGVALEVDGGRCI
jgi:3-oxoacyl-[acyl-carrier protein] reductase